MSEQASFFRAQRMRIIIYGGLLVMGFFFFKDFARNNTYPIPDWSVPSPPPDPLREVVLTGAQGRITAWLMESDKAADHAPIVVFFHGNAENIASLYASGFYHKLTNGGFHILAVDFPGYGSSEGEPNEAGLVESGVLGLRWALANYPDRPVVVSGWSLGAAVAIQTVAQEPGAAAIVLISPWASLAEVGRAHYPAFLVRMILREEYDSLAAAARIKVPSLVLHGTKDELIPFEQGGWVAEALPHVIWAPVEDYGHNDVVNAPMLWVELYRFLREDVPALPGSEP